MDINTAHDLISRNMKTVLGFACSRLSDIHEAEELASDILYELLRSADRLRDDSRFYAFMWRVAENTYINYLRRKKKYTCEPAEENLPSAEKSVEEQVELREDIAKLRLELSLMAEQYRQVTVLYYIEDMSCRQIAEQRGISVEMVKYYLFRARKILREGMNMERILGEKSYAPQPFRIEFWGDAGANQEEYRAFRDRKLKGNILLSAYYNAVTLQELAMELGISVPYLEDEVKLLCDKGYLIEKNGKYQTNIPVFTAEYDEKLTGKIEASCQDAREKLIAALNADCGDFRKKYGHLFRCENLLRWQSLTLCSLISDEEIEAEVKNTYGNLPHGGAYSTMMGQNKCRFVWGISFERKEKYTGFYSCCDSTDGRGRISALNFVQLQYCQHFMSRYIDMISCAAVRCFDYLDKKCKSILENEHYTINGKPNFAVYTAAQFEEIKAIFKNSIDGMTRLNREIYTFAAKTAANHAPAHIRETAEHWGAVIFRKESPYYLANDLLDAGWLSLPDVEDKPAMFEVTAMPPAIS